jgi:AAA+ ATPase superfamily predicted ATPase/predicted transcriptional regulator
MYGDPVYGEDFFDREEILSLLHRRAASFREGDKRNLALVGLRKMGKTSILLEFKRSLSNPEFLPVFVYIKPEDVTTFAHRFTGALLYEFLMRKDHEPDEDMEQLLSLAIEHAPRTASAILRLRQTMETAPPESVFTSVLDLPMKLRQETGLHPIIIFDEFQNFASYRLDSPLHTLREKLFGHRDVMYLIAGSAVSIMDEMLASQGSPLYGHFEVITVSSFDYQNSKLFLSEKLKGINVPDTHQDFLVSITEGHPYYLDLLTFRIKDICQKEGLRSAPQSVIIEALAQEIFSTNGTIYLHLRDLIDRSLDSRGYATYIAILQAVAQGAKNLTDIAKELSKTAPEINRQVRRLLEMDLLDKVEAIYLFKDPLLQLWLKYVFAAREESFVPELSLKLQQFKTNLEQMIASFKTQMGLGNEARIRELFSLFDNETVSVSGRRLTLPKFDEVSPRIINNHEFDLVARRKDQHWVAEIKSGNVTPGDVNNYARKLEELPFKPQERILICLLGIENQALIAAQRENIWVWGLSDINLLMKLYGRFRIVH